MNKPIKIDSRFPQDKLLNKFVLCYCLDGDFPLIVMVYIYKINGSKVYFYRKSYRRINNNYFDFNVLNGIFDPDTYDYSMFTIYMF